MRPPQAVRPAPTARSARDVLTSDAARAALPAWEAVVDVVVVGSGVAGLTAALDASAAGLSVLTITKGDRQESSTQWAQGGVAVVRDERDPGDTVRAHVRDTVVAGAGLTDPAVAELILGEGPEAVARLIARGASFDAGPQGLLRTREGGHSANRVIHAGGDATGAEIERTLLRVPTLPAVLNDHLALDVVVDVAGRAAAVSVLASDGSVGLVRGRAIVLATGGSGQLWAVTTNPSVATADGLAMGLRAGAEVADVEFMQFHPTGLWTGPVHLDGSGTGPEARTPTGSGPRPLLTEALRGEGAVLIDGAGQPVMRGVHPLGDLAPRDVVSLAITRRMASAPGGISNHVFLDATGLGRTTFATRFPTAAAACAAIGIDPAVDPIPVAPAAHYHCGGIVTDLDGRTTVPGLFAVGEVARTGLHGANRLASNSLLEGLVMGQRAAAAIALCLSRADRLTAVAELVLTPIPVGDAAARSGLQAAMSAHAGIGRQRSGLARAARVAARAADGRAAARAADGGPAAWAEGSDTASGVGPDRESVEAANLSLVADAVLRAARMRRESRGCHVRTDHPAVAAGAPRSVVLQRIPGGWKARTQLLQADRPVAPRPARAPA